MRRTALLLASAGIFTAGCAAGAREVRQSPALVASGESAPDPGAESEAARKRSSLDGALADARGRLYSAVADSAFRGYGRAGDAMRAEPALDRKVRRAIAGLQDEAEWDNAMECRVSLRLPARVLKDLDSRFLP